MTSAGSMRERILFEKPATTPERDVYGHQTDNAANWTTHTTVWANAEIDGSKHTLKIRYSDTSADITSGDRATRADGTILHVLNAFDPDGKRTEIHVDAEPA